LGFAACCAAATSTEVSGADNAKAAPKNDADIPRMCRSPDLRTSNSVPDWQVDSRKAGDALDAVLGPELVVAADVEIGLPLAHRHEIANLRTDRCDARLETAENPRARGAGEACRRIAVWRNLIIEVADEADVPLLVEKLRGGPVEVQIDAVAVVGGRVDEVERRADDRRKFASRRRVEIGVAAAAVDRAVADADVGKV
jgi:hypothetical protein